MHNSFNLIESVSQFFSIYIIKLKNNIFQIELLYQLNYILHYKENTKLGSCKTFYQ